MVTAVSDRVRVSVRVSVMVYSVVYSIYGKFHIYRPSRHCYSNFSHKPDVFYLLEAFYIYQ